MRFHCSFNVQQLYIVLLFRHFVSPQILAVIFTAGHLGGGTGIFMVSLAVADLCRGLLVMPFVLMTSCSLGRWAGGEAGCKFCGFAGTVFQDGSLLTLAAVSVDR